MSWAYGPLAPGAAQLLSGGPIVVTIGVASETDVALPVTAPGLVATYAGSESLLSDGSGSFSAPPYYNGAWSTGSIQYTHSAGQIIRNGAGWGSFAWGTQFGPDVIAVYEISAWGECDFVIRGKDLGGSNWDAYDLYYSGSGTFELYRVVNAVASSVLDSASVTPSAGDKIGFVAIGSGASVEIAAAIYSGGAWGPDIIRYTDTNAARLVNSGYIGAWANGTTMQIDSLSGGDAVSGGGPITVNVGIASEADAAQPVGKAKAKAIGVASETEAAQAVASRKTIAVGQATEADVSLAVAAAKAATVGVAAETDVAQPVTRPGLFVAVGQASESDAALAVSALKTTAVGQAAETDAAVSVSASKTAQVGAASETDAALAFASAKTVAVGQASETDAALAVSAAKTTAVGEALETDVALPVAAAKTVTVGQASETDVALGVTVVTPGEIVQPVGQASEADAAQAVQAAKTALVGVASETEAALGVVAAKTIEVGVAVETATAFGVVSLKRKQIGQAASSDVALSLTAVRAYTLAAAVETDTAFPVSAAKTAAVGLATETDEAITVHAVGGVVVLGRIASAATAGVFSTARGPSRLATSPSAGELAGAAAAGRFDATTPGETI